MKANTATIAMILAMVAMIGMTGFAAATTYDSSVTLENKDGSWQPIADDFSAVIEYNSIGDEFEWSASGIAPLADTEYSLIYYADEPDRFVNWGGDNPGALIGTMTTNGTGTFTASGSTNLGMDLPCEPDANMNISEHDYCGTPDYYEHCTGAKLWMVPSADYTEPALTAWNPANYLFETDLITYTNSAVISIGDASCIDTVPIMISNAENVGSVQLTLSYNPEIANITEVTNGDMDEMERNLETGQVLMITWQNMSAGLTGTFDLAYITFDSVGDGTCPLNIIDVTFKDATPDANNMPYQISNGSYTACVAGDGDANGDGNTDSGDVMIITKHLAGIPGFENIDEAAADYNGDGVVDSDDVRLLARCLIGIPGDCPD